MMYNMVNNVRGSPCGKKEEAIPMARKWLSGALAFAMIFGCSAPMALADETPVEVVEVEQNSLEGVEQYASYAPTIADVTIAAGKTVTVTVGGNLPENAALSKDWTDGNVTIKTTDYDAVTHELTIKAEDDFDEKVKVTLEFTGATTDYYAPVTFTVKPADTKEYEHVVFDGKAADSDAIAKDVTVGATLSIKVGAKENASSGDPEAAVTDLKVEQETGSSEYFKYEIKEIKTGDKVTGNEIVITGLKSTGEDSYKLKISGRPDEGKALVSQEYEITVSENEIFLRDIITSATTMSASGTITFAPRAMTEDDYGNVIQVDAPALKWYANDIEIKGGDLEFNNGNELSFTINTDNGTVTMSKPNDGKIYTGSVTVKAVTPDGSDSASVTVTVVGDQIWAVNAEVHPVGEGNKPDDDAINSYVGGTVKLADVKYGVYNVEEGTSVAAEDYLNTVKNLNATVKYKSLDTKAATVDENGVVTILDNEYVAEQLKDADYFYAKIEVSFTFPASVVNSGDEVTKKFTQEIKVNKASDKVKYLNVKVGDKEIAKTENANSAAIGNYIMTVGKTADFDVEVLDNNKVSTGIDQGMIWYVENGDSDDTNVYATVDAATGVVTPLTVSAGKAWLKGVSVANPNYTTQIRLYIQADPNATPIPDPTVAPTVQPTEAPTVAPTEKPAERTGVVVNVSSNLNIRAAANTSSTVVTKVKNGTNLVILGEEGNFYKVQLADGKIGYASKDYVRETTDTPVQPTGDYAIVTTKGGRLNMRQTAGGAVITSIANGTRVDVISEGSEWTLIEYNGRQGYVSTGFLTIYHGAVG